MKLIGYIGIVLMVMMVGCKPPTTSPRPSPGGEGVDSPALTGTPSQRGTTSRTLENIDSLMWVQADSALKVMLEFAGSEEVDSLNEFEGHYCQLLIAELLFKNDYGQSNREEVLKAVGYFDSIVDLRGADARGASPQKGASQPFLAARAHYINGAGYYEQGDLVNACAEYLNTLRIMENHFAENELVGKKARFMALTYNRLVELFSAQYMQEPTIYCGKQSLVYNRMAKSSPRSLASTLRTIGQQYDKLNLYDSANIYYNAALKYLPDRNDLLYRDVVSLMAFSEYEVHHDTIASLDSLKSMVAQAADETERITRYLTIGYIYYDIRQCDSAKVYLVPVFKKDPDRACMAARLLRDIALIESDTVKANQYALILAEEGATAANNQARASQLNDMFQSYLQEKQEAASLRERRKAVRMTLMVLLPLLLVIGLAVAIVMRRRHGKRLTAQEAVAQQRLEAERQSHRMEQAALSGRLKRSNETLRELQDQVRQQNDTTTKPATQASTFVEEPICRLIMERVNEGQFKSQMDCTVYKDYALGKEQVAALREAADRHFNQFTSRLAKAYPELTRGDLDYCCLYLLGLSDADVAALMQKAYSTVSDRSRKLKNIFGNEMPFRTLMLDFANGKTLV